MPKVKPGDKAPDFTLKDLQGRDFHLHDSLGGRKTVLVFYRGEWSPVCNRYLAALEKQAAEFRENNAQLIAISTDTAAQAWDLKRRLGLSFGLLPGLDKQIVAAYDLFYNDQFSHGEPAVFILHPDGTVAYAAITSGAFGRSTVEDVLMIVSRL